MADKRDGSEADKKDGSEADKKDNKVRLLSQVFDANCRALR